MYGACIASDMGSQGGLNTDKQLGHVPSSGMQEMDGNGW